MPSPRSRRSRPHRAGLATLALAVVAGAGVACSDDAPEARPTSGTGLAPGTTLVESCPETTAFRVHTTGEEPLEDEPRTAYADVVGRSPQSATFTFSNTEVAIDAARELRSPEALEPGDYVVIVAVRSASAVTAGTYVVEADPDDEATVHYYAFYDHTGRVFGPEPTVVVHATGADQVCGELIGTDEPGSLSGAFAANRIDSGATRADD